MKSNPYKPLIITLFIGIIIFVVHKFSFTLFAPKNIEATFVYSLLQIDLIFLIFSLIILFILVKINQKNINNVGFAFMLLTSIKMALAFFLLQPILDSTSIYAQSEKMNFFAIFILFLIIETTITIRILNNKQ